MDDMTAASAALIIHSLCEETIVVLTRLSVFRVHCTIRHSTMQISVLPRLFMHSIGNTSYLKLQEASDA